jgi:hypothetical protein
VPYRVATPPPTDARAERRAALGDELALARGRSRWLLQAVGLVSVVAVADGPIVAWMPGGLRTAGSALWLALLLAWLVALYERWWIGRQLKRLAQSR